MNRTGADGDHEPSAAPAPRRKQGCLGCGGSKDCAGPLCGADVGHGPGVALTAVSPSCGIGVNIGIFAREQIALLRPVYERPDEVVEVQSRSTRPDGGGRGLSYPNYLDIREGTTGIFAHLSAFSLDFVGLDAGDGARRTLAFGVTANYFQFFGRPLALGRPFTTEEARLGTDSGVAIVSHSFWERRGADPNMIGQTVRVNGEPFTVIGVAPKGFTGTGHPRSGGGRLWASSARARRII